MDAQQQARVDALIKSVLRQEKLISPGKHLIEDLGLDSLGMLELTAAIEDEFDVLIPVSRVNRIRTVEDLYRAVDALDEYTITQSAG